jgi:hypothetical protein
MFSVYCPADGARVLLGTDDITALTNTPSGVLVEWRCPCGASGTWRARRARRTVDQEVT